MNFHQNEVETPAHISLLNFIGTQVGWSGTVCELLNMINHAADSNASKLEKDWPDQPQALAVWLRHAARQLRSRGVTVKFRKSDGQRIIEVAKI